MPRVLLATDAEGNAKPEESTTASSSYPRWDDESLSGVAPRALGAMQAESGRPSSRVSAVEEAEAFKAGGDKQLAAPSTEAVGQ
ncbi:hypothetical protein AB1Y20_014642 [Prymnesium parvum]|uniref:Uncharacterized protein n=1 Tax=Prymnesium parvum TaxID=97485 RepID=A0AB34IB74_PRYPA